MKILITGGAGFIGSHLCEHLVDMDHKVIVIDDFSSGLISNLDNISSKITLISKKIEDYDFQNSADVDVVVHLAAQASVPFSISNFYESSETNLLTSIKVIDFCAKNKIPLVYASSSAIYGELELGDDESDSLNLLSPYAVDKYAQELYAKVANLNTNLSSIGLRFFNVYGPRQDPTNPYSGVISIFVSNLLSDKEIIINGGLQTRDFVYVKDVISVIEIAIQKVYNSQTCDSVNVLTGKSFSINYLANKLIEIIQSKSNIIFRDLPIGDPERSNGTIEKLKTNYDVKLDNFEDFENGLKFTVEDMKNGAK